MNTMQSNLENQLVLKKRLFIEFKRELLVVSIAMLLLIVLLPVLMLLVIGEPFSLEGLNKIFNHIVGSIEEAFAEDPLDASINVLAFIGLIGFFVYLYLANRYERLVISPLGIQYLSPLQGALKIYNFDWFLRWEQVTDAYLQQARAGLKQNFSTLNLLTTSGRRKLQPALWGDPATYKPAKKKFFTLSAASSLNLSFEEIKESVLVKSVRQYLPVKELEIREAGKQFDLGSHPATIVFTASLIVFICYAAVDTFFVHSDVYIETPPYEAFITGGAIMAFIAFLVMKKSSIPAYIGVSLALMNGVAFGAAMHPGLLRINQLTDNDGQQEYAYIREENNVYRPVNPGPPKITMHEPYEYWAQFEAGSEYAFRLRKGALGFWQLDEGSLVHAYRGYFTSEK